MASYYVDPAINANSGTGSIGDPFGDLQYALDTVTRDGTNGDKFNIKAGTAEVLSAAISLATYGTPTFTASLVFRGYTSTEGDGGIGEIDGGGSVGIFSGAGGGIHFIDLYCHNCGSADVLSFTGSYNHIQNCEVAGTTGRGVDFQAAGSMLLGSYIHDVGGSGAANAVRLTQAGVVMNCFIASGSSSPLAAINCTASRSRFIGNIISIGGSTHGIQYTKEEGEILGNSILSASGSGTGILLTGSGINIVANNLVEGFSTGAGISQSGQSTQYATLNNGVYNCGTAYSSPARQYVYLNNVTLTSTPFAKSGSNTYANRLAYFAPIDADSVVYNGSFWAGRDMGALQQIITGGASNPLIQKRLQTIGV